jgi:hypothetical protein
MNEALDNKGGLLGKLLGPSFDDRLKPKEEEGLSEWYENYSDSRGLVGKAMDFTLGTPFEQTSRVAEVKRNVQENKRPEDDFIDLESPTAQFVRGVQSGINEGNVPNTGQEKSALQKKYEEMGLEYDYTKREEGEVPYTEEVRKRMEQENPDFLKRNDQADLTTNVLEQLKDAYDKEMGRLDALELEVWRSPGFAGSEYGRTSMNVLRQQKSQAQNYYQAEIAKLDGQFYEGLPPKDMNVANMLLGKGLTGKQLTNFTKNHGNIRDTINDSLLDIPEDKKEEFKTRILGDYVRDSQGNIVTNEAGDELRKGSELVSLTPQGTYDFSISPKAFADRVDKVLSNYAPREMTPALRKRELESDIESLSKLINPSAEEPLPENQINAVKNRITTLKSQLVDLMIGEEGASDFIQKPKESFTNEMETPVSESEVTETETEVTETKPKSAPTKQKIDVQSTIEAYIKDGTLKRDENGNIIPGNESNKAKKIYERLIQSKQT